MQRYENLNAVAEFKRYAKNFSGATDVFLRRFNDNVARLDCPASTAEKIYLVAIGDACLISRRIWLGTRQKYQSRVGQLSGFPRAGNYRAEHNERQLHEHYDRSRRTRLSQKLGRIFERAD